MVNTIELDDERCQSCGEPMPNFSNRLAFLERTHEALEIALASAWCERDLLASDLRQWMELFEEAKVRVHERDKQITELQASCSREVLERRAEAEGRREAEELVERMLEILAECVYYSPKVPK